MKTLIRRVALVMLALILLTSSIGIAEGTAVKAVTLTSSQILSHAKKVEGTTYTKGYCLEWVATKFWKALGGSYSSSCCAYNYGTSRIVSTSKDDIPIGADVFFSGGSTKCKNGHTAGHIGVYIGDGKVINLIRYSSDPSGKAKVRVNTISQIEGWKYKYRGWGYHDGIKIQSDSTTPVSPVSGKNYTIFTQSDSKWGNVDKYSTRDGSRNDPTATLRDEGCCLFSFAHAIQWATESKYSDTIIDGLFSRCVHPSNDFYAQGKLLKPWLNNPELPQVHSVLKGCHNHKGTSLDAYSQFGIDHGIKSVKTPNTVSDQKLRNLFNDGYISVVNIKWKTGGHYVCAVDYAIASSDGSIINDDGKTVPSGGAMYIHIVDSSAWSSTSSGRPFYGKVYSIKDNRFVKAGTLSGGKEYWVKINSLNVHRALKGSWKGHGSNSEEGSLSGVYKTIRKCKLYTGPGISNKKAGSKKKNAIIIVESGVTNEYGNLWYKTVDGKYIYSGDVEKVNLTETQASGTFRFNKDDESREWPYEAAKLIKKYSKGAEVQVCAKVVNTYGNTWYKLTDGGYVWEGDLEQQVTLSELEFKNVVYPSVFHISASGWYLSSGELTSNYELTSITSEIRKDDSTTVSKATKTISGKSFSIKNLDDLSASSNDNGVRFSYIYSKGYGEGSYSWRLTATDASGAELLLVMPFTASNSAGGMESIASIKYGENKAKIKSMPVTGDIVKVSGGKYRVNNETMTAEYVEPTKKKISSVEIPATIEIAGGVYKVTAIGYRAFAGLENLTSVTIGKNVEKIGKKAFYKCLNLDKIKIKSKKLTAELIGKDAFKGISDNATISCPDELMKTYRKIILKNGASKNITFK